MLKMRNVCLAVAVASVLAAPVAQAAKNELTFGLGGGAAMPIGDFGDAFKLGFQGGVFGDYWVSDQFAIGVDVNYNKSNAKDEFNLFLSDEATLVAGFPVMVEAKSAIINFGAHGKYKFPVQNSSISPYIVGGLGIYNFKATVAVSGGGVSDEASSSESKIGASGGLGLDFKASPQVSVGVGGAFHNVFTEGSSTTYLSVGAHVTFSTASP